MNSSLKNSFIFLLIACSFSWLVALILYLIIENKEGGQLLFMGMGFVFMLGPSVAAIVCQKTILKRDFTELGFKFERKTLKWALYTILFFAGTYIVATIVIRLSGGNSFFGTLNFTSEEVLKSMKDVIPEGQREKALGSMGKIPGFVFFLITALSGMFIGGLLNTPLMLSEELGWRGFLFNQVKEKKFFAAALLTGIVWGLWHWPLIMMGHNYGDKGIAGVLMMTLFCISLAFPFHFFRMKSGNLLAPCLLHGMINGSATALSLFNSTANPLYGSYAGLAGVIGINLVFWPVYFISKRNSPEQTA